MTKYKKFKYVDKRNGKERILYQRNNKTVSPKLVPQEIKDSEIWGGTIILDEENDRQEEKRIIERAIKETSGKECLFCGQDANRERFVNLRMVYLCEKDYLNNTVGKIASFLNSK